MQINHEEIYKFPPLEALISTILFIPMVPNVISVISYGTGRPTAETGAAATFWFSFTASTEPHFLLGRIKRTCLAQDSPLQMHSLASDGDCTLSLIVDLMVCSIQVDVCFEVQKRRLVSGRTAAEKSCRLSTRMQFHHPKNITSGLAI